MDLIDAHTHLDTLSCDSLEQMSMTGVRTLIAPIHLLVGKAVGCETIRDVWDYLFDTQFARAQGSFITPYAMIGLCMVNTPRGDPEALYQALPEYLARPEVVAIGEIGLEPNSRTCSDMKMQESYVVRQLAIAKGAGVCVNFHTPNAVGQKQEATRRVLDLCAEAGLSMDKVIVDHCSDANIGLVRERGAWAAISVQPWRRITPDLAAEFVKEFGTEGIMIDSDCSPLPSDPLAVPKTALALKRKGFSDGDIEKVCAGNCRAAYGI